MAWLVPKKPDFLPTMDAEIKLFRGNYKAIFQQEQMNTAQLSM